MRGRGSPKKIGYEKYKKADDSGMLGLKAVFLSHQIKKRDKK